MLTQTGSGLSFTRSLRRFLPAVGPCTHTHKQAHMDVRTDAHTHPAGPPRLLRPRRGFGGFSTSIHHLLIHLHWLACSSFCFFGVFFILQISYSFHSLSSQPQSVLRCHNRFRAVMSEMREISPAVRCASAPRIEIAPDWQSNLARPRT